MSSQLRGKPFLVVRDYHPVMRKLVHELVSSGQIDAVHIDQISMAQFIPGRGDRGKPDRHDVPTRGHAGPLVVFDAHNAVWKVLDRLKETAPLPLQPVIALEARRMRKYEGEVVASSDYVLAVSEADGRLLLEAAASGTGMATDCDKLLTVPIAVDTQALRPTPRPSGSFRILTLGTLHYPPNADGIRWFLRAIFPLIKRQVPEATLTIVGKNPPKDLLRMADRYAGDVSITGYVADLKPYLTRAAVLVVPVRVGGGMRVRILEAFAFGIPTVTTTVGLEGIDGIPGEHVLVGDQPEDFAAHVVNLLKDELAQAKLAKNGRWLAEDRYDRRRVLKKLDRIYAEPVPALS
jgi:glycosyltransferase involved in cell wall biosynthesis